MAKRTRKPEEAVATSRDEAREPVPNPNFVEQPEVSEDKMEKAPETPKVEMESYPTVSSRTSKVVQEPKKPVVIVGYALSKEQVNISDLRHLPETIEVEGTIYVGAKVDNASSMAELKSQTTWAEVFVARDLEDLGVKVGEPRLYYI